MELEGAVAIVTGAARGIGCATAVALARAGAKAVVLVDVKKSEMDTAAGKVEAAGAKAVPSDTDVADLAALRALFEETESRFGRLDVLHNNAGIGEGPPDWPDIEPERVAAVVDVNLRAVVLGTQLALGPMQRSGGGAIVNTASGAAFVPLSRQAAYAATKAGVVHFTRSCAALAQSHRVRVNCVCPGIVDTPMLLDTGDGEIAGWLRPVYDAVEPLAPEEIADAVLALIHDDSKAGESVTVENRPRD